MTLVPCCPQHRDRDVQSDDTFHAGIACQHIQETPMATTDLENRPAAVLHRYCIDGLPYRTVVTADLFVVRQRHVVPLLFMDRVALPLLTRDESGNARRQH